ncbi:MAG: reverse transcriptase family protein [Archangium sp.]
MSFWDQVRRMFGGGGTAQTNAVRDAMLSRVAKKESFTAQEIANEATANDPHRTADDLRAAADTVHRLAQDGLLVPLGYKSDATGRFGPVASPPLQPPPSNVVASVGSAGTTNTSSSLSVEDRLRASIKVRAAKRQPFSTMDLVFEITKTGAPDFMSVATTAGNLAKEMLPGLGFALESGMWRHGSVPAVTNNEPKIRASLQARAGRRESFVAAEVAAEITRTDNPQFQSVLSEVVSIAAKVLPGLGYVLSGGTWRPAGQQQQPPPALRIVPPVQQQSAPPPPRPPPPVDRTYETNPEILGLSAEELRKRAVKMNPFATPWIGRVDTIPPQSDERTALIDRGLMLRGLLSVEQLAEIHRVGDLWLKFSEADRLAEAMALRTADEAIAKTREEKAKKRAEKKKLAEAKEAARVAAVAKRKAEDIIFLGRGVSSGLADRRANLEALEKLGLPQWLSPADVAKGLGLSIPQLRWLSFHAEATAKPHYAYFEIPRRSGGTRLLSAPHAKLKAVQRKILDELLVKVPLEPEAHGFVKGRSIVTNALPHLGQGVVLNVDLKDFFPTVTFRRVRGLFQAIGFSPAVATVLGLLCTDAPRRQVEFDGKKLWVAVGERRLPQGAPTSPAIANLISRRLDRRLKGRLAKRGWTYTRYADDLSFSRKDFTRAELGFVHASIRHVIEDEGFALNPKKGRAQGKGARQEVTGVVVNTKLNVGRDELRRLRAQLHQAKKKGAMPAEERRVLEGKIAFVSMINPLKGGQLKAALAAIPK